MPNDKIHIGSNHIICTKLKSTPIISVIIPVFNAQSYLLETLKSLQSQTFEQFEVIIINDGSTDSSKSIINNFILSLLNNIQKDDLVNTSAIPIFKLFNIKNSGVSKARNIGLKYANPSSKYVMFLDADDLLSENALEQMYLCTTQSRCQVSMILINAIYDYFSDNSDANKLWIVNKKNYLTKSNSEILDTKLLVYVWGKLYKHETIKKYNLFFNEELAIGEDYLFNLQYLLSTFSFDNISSSVNIAENVINSELDNKLDATISKTIAFSERGEFFYRQSTNSLSRTTSKNNITKRMICAEHTANYLLQYNFSELSKKKYIVIGYINPLKLIIKSRSFCYLSTVVKLLDFNIITLSNLTKAKLTWRAKILALAFYPIMLILKTFSNSSIK